MYKTKNKLFFFLTIITLAILAIGLIDSVSAVDITIDSKTPGGLKKTIENASNGDTIYLENGVYSGKENTGLRIHRSITISGKGSNVVIDAKIKDNIFNIAPDTKVTLKNLKLINGKSTGHGGAIYSQSSLIVSSCNFNNNQARKSGGAISIHDSDGTLTVSGSIFANNKCDGIGGAIFGGRANRISVSDSIFTNNKAIREGGAIYGRADLSSKHITGSTFTNNKAIREGGAIYGNGFTVNNSKFTNNEAKTNGGAIYIRSDESTAPSILRLNSVTFKNNIGGSEYNAISSRWNPKVYKNKVTITPADNTVVFSSNKADLTIAKVQKKGNYHHVTIKNIGKKATGNKFYLGVYDGTKKIKQVLVNSLGAGKFTTVKVQIAKKYENNLKTFKADSTNRIKESNKKNNSLKAR